MKRFLFFSVVLAMVAAPAFAADAKIERTWKSKCASCHGKDGKGDTDKGKQLKVNDMTASDYTKKFTDEQMKKAILNGVNEERDGVKKEMEPYKDELKPDQIDGLIVFIKGLSKPAK